MSDDNVENFTGYTTLPIPADRVLKSALDGIKGDVVVVGDGIGGDFYLATSNPNIADTLLKLEIAKQTILGEIIG